MQTKSLSERIAELKEFYASQFYASQKLRIGENDIVIDECLEIIDELEDELETRRAFIVANPCAQCGGKINAMKCEAWAEKAGELEAELEEQNLRIFVHQADANCSKRNHESDKIFYQKCIKNVRSERDELKEKVKELESKTEWRPIETAPKKESKADIAHILVFRGDEGFEEKFVTIENTSNSRFYEDNGFTHWMPLPKPPTQIKGE